MLNFIVSCTAIIVFSDVNYAVKDVTEGAEYEFRVAAINDSGAGDSSPPSEMVCAKNPNSKLLTVYSLFNSAIQNNVCFHQHVMFNVFSSSETLF